LSFGCMTSARLAAMFHPPYKTSETEKARWGLFLIPRLILKITASLGKFKEK
jgi:hypothetical protein